MGVKKRAPLSAIVLCAPPYHSTDSVLFVVVETSAVDDDKRLGGRSERWIKHIACSGWVVKGYANAEQRLFAVQRPVL